MTEELNKSDYDHLEVMVVDDDPSVGMFLQALLDVHDIKNHYYSDSQAALKEFTAHPDTYNTVLTDFSMPNLNGAKLASHIHKIRPEIPVILCSGSDEELVQEQEPYQGFYNCIQKPLDHQKLLRTLREINRKI